MKCKDKYFFKNGVLELYNIAPMFIIKKRLSQNKI